MLGGKFLSPQFLSWAVSTPSHTPQQVCMNGAGGGAALALVLGAPMGRVPPSLASLGSEHHLKSKIKNPSAHSRPAFAANGHLTQLN